MVNDLLERYSTDWSLFTIHPNDVIAPKNSQEIGEIVRERVGFVSSQVKVAPVVEVNTAFPVYCPSLNLYFNEGVLD